MAKKKGVQTKLLVSSAVKRLGSTLNLRSVSGFRPC
jgi:hypothetical protein